MSWPTQSGVSRTELDPTSFLHRSATIHPDRLAVVYGEQRRTYAELRERVDRLASALRARRPGAHTIAWPPCCPNVPELLELHHAVPAAGGVLVAINVRLSAAEIGYILEHSGSRVLFVDPELEPLTAEAPRRHRDHADSATRYEELVASRRSGGRRRRGCATRRSRSRSTTPRARRAARRASSTRTAART